MTQEKAPGIFVMVEFNWPRPFLPEHGKKARALHDAVEKAGWIEEIAAASGGPGAGASSIWIFRVPGYALLDRLLLEPQDSVCAAYGAFFADMVDVEERIRQEVIFI